ncbi:MAG: M48 family metallopeptidase [Deltaproteobacteria bacterium]|nr:M48 family metallopeptidase [Deltaproteobacteria bacterium]
MFELVRKNRNRSILLVGGMALLFAAVGYVAAELIEPGAGALGVGVAGVVGLGMFMLSYLAGDSVLLAAAGAREVNKGDAPQLANVVEEMVIASGLTKMPKIYVIESNAANAFATGRSPEVAAVAVTEGLLNMLSRDELQAVMAHELAHVKNRDILFLTLLLVMAGAIAIIADVVARYFFYGGGVRRSRSSSSSASGVQAGLIIIGVVLLILGPIVARLIFFAVSRTREYMADASSAIFTRNPEALASALEKISRNIAGTKLPVPKVAQPLLIVGPALFATHPPIDARIAVLRRLAGGGELSYRRYAAAYSQVAGKSASFMPKSAIGEAAVSARPAATASGAGRGAVAALAAGVLRREALDAVKKAAGYEIYTCGCGAKIKIPAGYPNKTKIRCLACGKAMSAP